MRSAFSVAARRALSIADLAELAGVTHRALRYYESAGLVEVPRDRFNARRYDPECRERIFLIVRLRRAGLTVAEIRKVLKLRDSGQPAAEFARGRMLDRLRAAERLCASIAGALAEVHALDAPTLGGRPPDDGAPRAKVSAFSLARP